MIATFLHWIAAERRLLVQELRLSLYRLSRSKVFLCTAILTLSMAIAANTVVYSAVDAILYPNVPFGAPEQLYRAHLVMQRGLLRRVMDIDRLLHNGGHTFEPAARLGRAVPEIVAIDGMAFTVSTAQVSPNYFDVLRVPPKYGRVFSGVERQQDHLAVVSERLWRRLPRSGRAFATFSVVLRGKTYSVIGILPRNGGLPENADVFVPFTAAGQCCGATILRVKPGNTWREANIELNGIAAGVDQEHLGYFFQLKPFTQARVTDLLIALSAATLALLVIACANVATLIIARGMARRREVAIRLALGSTRFALLRGLGAEGAILALISGVAGVALAFIGVALLSDVLPPYVASLGILEPQLSWRVLMTTVLLIGAITLGIGLLPALLLSETDLREALGSGANSSQATGKRRARLRGLVALEIGGAMALLVMAALMAAASHYVRGMELGYEDRHLVTGYVRLGGNATAAPVGDSRAAAIGQANQMLARIRSDPRVTMASLSWGSNGGADGIGSQGFTVEHASGSITRQFFAPVMIRWVSPDILGTLNIGLVRGPGFSATDSSGLPLVVIDERAATRLWPGEDPIGRALQLGVGSRLEPTSARMRVAGIIRPPIFSADGCGGAPCDNATILISMNAVVPPDGNFAQFVVRTRGNPAEYLSQLGLMLQADAPMLVSYARRWRDDIGLTALRERHAFFAAVFGALSIAGLLLALIGINGVAANTVQQRFREFGIRIALGATTSEVMKLVLYDGVLTALVGLVGGLVVSLATTRLVERLLYGVVDQTPIYMLLGLIVLFASTIAAGLGPALVAARTSPSVTLRSE